MKTPRRMGQQLDLLEAITEGEQAMNACLAKAEVEGFDTEGARRFVLSWLQNNGPALAEDAVDAAMVAGYVPHDERAFGGIFRSLSARNLIRRVGYAQARKCHGSMHAVWKAAA